MLGRRKSLTNYLILTSALSLSGCVAPFLIGGAAAAGMIATREKGIGGTATDCNISRKVKAGLYSFNADLHAKVSVSVQNQEVLLTGVVQDSNWASEAERIAKGVEDVKNVINHIETEGQESFGSLSQDSWITTRIKSSLLFESEVYSLNYTIETCNGIVYLTGIAQNETEVNRVSEIARNVSGVKKVVNHIKIKGQENLTTDPTQVQSGPPTGGATRAEPDAASTKSDD